MMREEIEIMLKKQKDYLKRGMSLSGKPIQLDNPALPNRVAATLLGRLRQ